MLIVIVVRLNKDEAPRSQTRLSRNFGKEKNGNEEGDLPSMSKMHTHSLCQSNKDDTLKRSATDPMLGGTPYHEHNALPMVLEPQRSPGRVVKVRMSSPEWERHLSANEELRQLIKSMPPHQAKARRKQIAKMLKWLDYTEKEKYRWVIDPAYQEETVQHQDCISQQPERMLAGSDKEKTKDKSGLRHIKRKAVNDSKECLQNSKPKKDRRSLRDFDFEAGDCPEHDHGHDHRRNRLFGSLSGSFAGSVANLDLPTPFGSSKTTFLGSKQSLLENMSTVQDKVAGRKGDKQMDTRAPFSSTPSIFDRMGQPPPPPQMLPTALAPTPSTADIETSTTQPCIFSVRDRKIVEGEIFREPRYPTGVNPLACHPQVNSFVQNPVERPVDPITGNPPFASPSVPRIQINQDEDEDEDEESDDDLDNLDALQDAIIYSASTGNLNTYARQTPSPARTHYDSPRSRMEKNSISDEPMTPSHGPEKTKDRAKEAGGLTRSITGLNIRENVSGLLHKATAGYKKLPEKQSPASEKQEAAFEKVGVAGLLKDIDPGAMEMPATPEKRGLFGRLGSTKKENETPANISAALDTSKIRSAGRENQVKSPSPLRKVYSSDSLGSMEREVLKKIM